MRSPQEVARRAYALALFKYRAGNERAYPSLEEDEREEVKEQTEDLTAFVDETKLFRSLSKIERKLFLIDLGGWHAQDALNAS